MKPRQPVPAKDGLPRCFLDPDPLREAPDDALALLRLSLTEHSGYLVKPLRQRLGGRVDTCRCRVASPIPRGLKLRSL